MPPPPSVDDTVVTAQKPGREPAGEGEAASRASAPKNVTVVQGGAPKPLSFGSIPVYEDPYVARQKGKERLAAAFRIFAKYGFDEGVAGHITLRDPVDPLTFWVNPFGMHFSLIKASDLIQVDYEGKIIDGGPVRILNTAAFMIHGAIHHARPDVAVAAHSHSIYGRTFSALGRELDMITQDSCIFYKDHVVYDQFNGLVMAKEEGENIARALGQKKAAILVNHGLLTTGATVEEAVFWFLTLEKTCQTQLMADAAAAGRGGQLVKIGDAEAEFTYNLVGTRKAGWFSGKPQFDVIEKETGGEYRL